MKRNKILIVIIILLLAAGVGLLTGRHNSTLKKQEADFTVRDTAAVIKIFMADKNNHSILLERKSDGWWVNDSIKANNRKASFLLSTLRRLRVKAPVSKAEYENVIRRMASIAVKVEVYQNDYRIGLGDIKLFPYVHRTKVFYVGDVTQNNLGTYMLMEGAEQPYIVYIPGFRGFVSSRFSPLINDWRSHILFHSKLGDIQSVQLRFGEKDKEQEGFAVEVVDALGNYRLKKLSDNRVLPAYDTLKVLNFLTSFADLRYEAHLNEALNVHKIDSIIHSPYLYRLILKQNNGDSTVLLMFKKNRFPDEVNEAYEELVPVDLDRFYGYLPKTGDFILLQYYSFDKILHPVGYYLKQEHGR